MIRNASLGQNNKKQMQHQNQKQNPLVKRRPVSSISRPRVPQNRLDTADFLIDGLLSLAPAGAGRGSPLGIAMLQTSQRPEAFLRERECTYEMGPSIFKKKKQASRVTGSRIISHTDEASVAMENNNHALPD